VGGCPGLWWRRLADGTTVYEIKLRQDGVLRSDTLPKGNDREAGDYCLEAQERPA
jgi:hypothetical protein